jgi:O-antigen/teichoic acid export membrane protein
LVLGVSLSIYLVVFRQKGIEGALIAGAITSLFMLITMMPILLRNINFRFSKSLLKQCLRYGLPFIPHTLAVYALFGVDRYFLNYYSSLSEIGVYSLAYKFALVITVGLAAMQNVWTPFRNELFNKTDGKVIISRTTTYWFVIITAICMAVSLFAKEVLVLMADKKFWQAYEVVPILAIGYWFLSGYHTFGVTGIDATKTSKWYPVVSFIGLLINIILNFALIPPFGIWGAAAATAFAYLGMCLSSLIISNRLYYVKYEWKRLYLLFGTGTGLYLFGNYLTAHASITASLLIKLGLFFIIFPSVLFGCGFMRLDEKRFLKRRLLGFVQ